MSTIVGDIVDESKALAVTTFGVTYHELNHIYDLTKNNIRLQKLGFAIRPLSADSVDSILKNYTLDHIFELILTDTTVRNDDDAVTETKFNTMFEKGHDFFKALVNTKINLATSVLNIQEPAFGEPEILPEVKLLVLRMQYTVKYRIALT